MLKPLLFFFTVSLGLLTASAIPAQTSLVYDPAPLVLSCERLECVEEPKLDFLLALDEVSSDREWERGVYMCGNFSRDYNGSLTALGYDSRYVTGRITPGSEKRHAWVELTLTLDPASGVLVKPNETFYVEDGR